MGKPEFVETMRRIITEDQNVKFKMIDESLNVNKEAVGQVLKCLIQIITL